MKIKCLVCVLSIFLLTSCIPDGIEDKTFVGFQVDIANDTDSEISNAKLSIVTLKNEEFITVDSLTLPSLIERTNKSFSQVIVLDKNRWKPKFKCSK